ncbi:hypothetical protein OAN13_03080 [Opitutales bacterium]|nr:hypothetical protein [Opitutales bacterium]
MLECDGPIVFEDENKTVTAKDGASLRGDNFLLLAEEITWDRSKGEATATGDVCLTKGDTRILADKVHLLTKNGNYIAWNVTGGSPPKVFIAETMERNSSIETFSNARFYMSEPSMFEPNLRTSRYSVDQNNSTFSINYSQVRIGDVLIGVLPGFSSKKNAGFGPSSLFKIGEDSLLGWYGELGINYSWEAVSSQTKLTYYQNRGLFIKPTISYDKKTTNTLVRTRLSGGWINDQGTSIGNDLRGAPIGRSRSYAQLRNLARFNDRWRSATLIEWERDSDIIRDFQRNYFYRNQWNQSHSELTYEGNGYSASILSKWQAHDHEAKVEQLPLISLEFGPLPKWTAYHSGSLNYARLIRRDDQGRGASPIDRMSVGYKIEKPFRLYKGIHLTPSLATVHQVYDFDSNTMDRTFGEYGIDLHANLHQLIPFENTVWEIEKVLHLTKFSLGFRSTNFLSGSPNLKIPNIYPFVEDLNLSPLDLLDDPKNESIIEKNLVRLGWENSFWGKWNDANRKLLSMRAFYDLWSSYPEGVDGGRFLYGDISIHPSSWLSINLRQKVDLKSGKNYRKSYGINLRDGRFQGASLSYMSYLNFNKYLFSSAWKRLNEKLFCSTSALYDLKQKSLSYWRSSLEYRTGSSWIWDTSMTQRKGTRKENITEWTIGLSLSGFKLNQLTEPDGLNSLYSM